MRVSALMAAFCLALSSFASAQQLTGTRNCATNDYLETLKQQNPYLEQERQQAQQDIHEQLQQQRQWQNLRVATTISIPVVFHVVYSNSTQNISDAQVMSQLEVLNADFRRMNADVVNTPSYFQPVAADTKIEFCLAALDPDGNPTSGITRTQTNRTEFDYTNDQIKSSSNGGVNAWDRNRYLNIWVGDIKDDILGYATLPGTAPARLDGVVLHYAAIGAAPANPFIWPYNMGRTATHEVGHWLGLEHIWGGDEASCSDSDGISDTPNQNDYTIGCPSGIQLSCNNGPYGNMYQNYMDYSDDACMNLFTKGQADYMNAVLSTTRKALLNALVCSASIRADFGLAKERDTLVVAGTSVQFADASAGLKPTSWLWEFEGGVPATSTQQNPTVMYPAPGKYAVKLTVNNGALSNTLLKEDFIQVTVNDLTVYPNPTSSYINIEQPARILVRRVELMNSVGKTVLTADVRDRILQLDVRHLQTGVYFLRLLSTNGTEIRKINILR